MHAGRGYQIQAYEDGRSDWSEIRKGTLVTLLTHPFLSVSNTSDWPEILVTLLTHPFLSISNTSDWSEIRKGTLVTLCNSLLVAHHVLPIPNTLSMHLLNISDQHINTPYKHTYSTPCQYTRSTHFINTPNNHTYSTSINTHSPDPYTLSTHIQCLYGKRLAHWNKNFGTVPCNYRQTPKAQGQLKG